MNQRNKKIAAMILMSITPVFSIAIITKQIEINKAKAENTQRLKQLNHEQEYQLKITGFDAKKYNMPTSNPSRGIDSTNCINGFGGKMPAIHQGMFDEPLYHLDAEKIQTDVIGRFAYAPYTNAYYVVGDILFKKPLDLFDRSLITVDSLHRNLSNINIIASNQSYRNSYGTMESKFGFPHGYLQQQAGRVVGITAFNDDCVKGVALKNITYKKIDLSGLPVALILNAKYNTSLHHAVNGLFNYTDKTADYVSNNFLEWVQSNNRGYLSVLNSGAKFEKGSFVYIPDIYENVEEVVYVDLKHPVKGVGLNQWAQDLATQHNIPVSDIDFTYEKVAGLTIVKPHKKTSLEPLGEYILSQAQDKKWYIGKWELPYKTVMSGDEPYRNQMSLLNQKALESALRVFKSTYQGSQLDVGTDNENLDERYNYATSADAQSRLESHKMKILEVLENNNERQSNQ